MPASSNVIIAARIAQPWRVLPTALPKHQVRPTPIDRIERIWTKSVSAVGFSNGCAELALKKPPPLVPSILIASWLATGPRISVCFAPSSVVASIDDRKVCGTPLAIRYTA